MKMSDILLNSILSESVIQEGVHDPHALKAVFMAGSVGAGKTTVANKLFRGSGLKELNVDKFWHFFNQRKNDKSKDYNYYWEKYKSLEKLYLNGKLGLLIDGTAKNPLKIKETKLQLESLGYDTCLVFVNTSLETSMNRAAARAQTPGPDFGREIDKEFIEDSWNRTQHGMTELQHIFAPNFFVINNNDDRTNDLDRVGRNIKRWLNSRVSNPIGKTWKSKSKEPSYAA